MESFTPNKTRRGRFRLAGIILYSILFISCLKGKKQEKETYYIPNGYEGKIYVLFDCKDGTPKKWINGRRLYEIPPSGILKTQFEYNKGYLLFQEKNTLEKKLAEEFRIHNEQFDFYFVDENYKPIKKINYAYLNLDSYKTLIDTNDYNVWGNNNVFRFGRGNEEYTATYKYIQFGADTKFNLSNDITQTDWYRIERWNSLDMRIDSTLKNDN